MALHDENHFDIVEEAFKRGFEAARREAAMVRQRLGLRGLCDWTADTLPPEVLREIKHQALREGLR